MRLAISLEGALAADHHVQNLDYRLAWNEPHAGNYDVPEAMAWITKVVGEAGDPLAGTKQGEVGGTRLRARDASAGRGLLRLRADRRHPTGAASVHGPRHQPTCRPCGSARPPAPIRRCALAPTTSR